VKIGIIGIGVKPDGLIEKDNYAGMEFLPVVETVNQYAAHLREKEKCDIVICLSHIGYTSDKELADQSHNVDVILGGHSHTFMKQPEMRKNPEGKDVYIYQAGARGVVIGKTEIELTKKKK